MKRCLGQLDPILFNGAAITQIKTNCCSHLQGGAKLEHALHSNHRREKRSSHGVRHCQQTSGANWLMSNMHTLSETGPWYCYLLPAPRVPKWRGRTGKLNISRVNSDGGKEGRTNAGQGRGKNLGSYHGTTPAAVSNPWTPSSWANVAHELEGRAGAVAGSTGGMTKFLSEVL